MPTSLIPRFLAFVLLLQTGLHAKNASAGSSLWLNYQAPAPGLQKEWSAAVRQVFCPGSSAIVLHARDELLGAAGKLTGRKVALSESPDGEGTVLLGSLEQLKEILPKATVERAGALKEGGYVIESVTIGERKATVIVSRDEAGVLFGVFHFIRLMQTGMPAAPLSVSSEPAIELRMLNHWDNMNGSIERGYGGKSLWKWDELPGHVNWQCHDYARFCASIGINGVVLNNVNADPGILRQDYLVKVAALADVFRTWGIRTYVSANFAAPLRPAEAGRRVKGWRGVGNLDTADPLDPAVAAWWKNKADEIYRLIPDFGGFLVKADSEGQPGPRSYQRTHAEGANMLADALAPHGGSLIWRAFVYGRSDDRAMDAYHEFKPLDGKFRDNVFLQVKNGPLDFQPREPFTPLVGAMPDTDLALELQIAKEYLGHATTLAYLGPMWTEILGSDTHAKGSGSTLAKVIDGSLHGSGNSCIAGVANTGDGAQWCGSVFNQANWYAFGRLAWNPGLSAEEIAEEWIRMTFPCDAPTRATILKMMMGSHEALVDYSMPLGLNLLVAMSDHYRPSPETRMSFHKADANGLGFERTKQGSNYAGQYHPELQAIFNDPDKTPLNYLLWFHHVPWDAKLSTGRTLWDELTFRYDRGVKSVDQMAESWQSLEGKIAPDIHASVMNKLLEEKKLSRQWRDECISYFSGFANAEVAPIVPIAPIVAPFVMPQLQRPDVKNRVYRIDAYGAVPGGKIKNTEAIRKAITACHQDGGGTVLVPEGKWLTGPVHLKSNVQLKVDAGAELLFTDHIPDYLPAVESAWEGFDCYNYSPLIYAVDCENIAVIGKGQLTCIRDAWAEWDSRPESHMETLKKLYYMAADGVPVEKRQVANDKARMRPPFIEFLRCKNVLIEGLVIRNSPFWTIHPVKSENVITRDLDVKARGHNTDGIDPDQTKNMLIENCIFDQGDDAMVIKAGRNHDGWRGQPSENIVIRNCTIRNGHRFLAIGSEMSGGVRNIYLHDCKLDDANGSVGSLLFLKTNHRRGGFIENIHIKNVNCPRVTSGVLEIETDVLYQWRDLVETVKRSLTPIRGIHLENISVGEAKYGIRILGDNEMPIRTITLKNVTVDKILNEPRVLSNVEGITEDQVRFGGRVVR